MRSAVWVSDTEEKLRVRLMGVKAVAYTDLLCRHLHIPGIPLLTMKTV